MCGPGKQGRMGRAEGDAVYGPDEIRLMRSALAASWSALAFAHFDSESEARATRERLARRILEETAQGVRSLSLLSGRALGALEPRRAGTQPWRSTSFAS